VHHQTLLISKAEMKDQAHDEYMVVADLAMMDRKLNYLGAADMTAVSFYVNQRRI
jgi:hypothetical protein